MATEVKLPDLGEGVDDASISRWLVQEGDDVNEGDAILEVATDKVDTEVPAPASGKILKLAAGEGAIVAVGEVLAVIGEEGESVDADSDDASEESAKSDDAVDEGADDATEPSKESSATSSEPTDEADVDDVRATPVAKRVAAEKGVRLQGISGSGPGGQITKDDVLATLTDESDNGGTAALPDDLAGVASLEVRRLAAEHNIGLDEVANGRPFSTLTRYDVLNAIAARSGEDGPATKYLPPKDFAYGTQTSASSTAASESAPATAPSAAKAPAEAKAPAAAASTSSSQGAVELIKPNRMRQLIAQNTFASLQSSPQLTTWHDVDMTTVINHRKAHKAEFAANGVNLTVTAYLIAATIEGLKAVPAANSRWTDDGIAIYRTYNIGMAAAIPADKYGLGGLIVPVIKNAGDLNLQGIARQVNELAEKARNSKIGGPDLQDGTFTVTNYGTSGSVFQTPIIHQGQAGILGTGAIEKRAVVVSNGSPLEANLGDYLSFKPMMTLAFTFDHRVLDGATADAFCVAVKNTLETWT